MSLIRVETRIEHAGWRRSWPKAAAEAKALILKAAASRSLKPVAKGEVAIVFADDATLKDLNARFRGKDKPTNVLSFPDETLPLGGIALAFETISAEAGAQNKTFVNHAKHMILHGFLHLLGHDHERTGPRRLMEGLEIAILSDMGIPNPYVVETKTRA